MSEEFEVGVTRDFLTADGQLTYKDIGLGEFDAEPRCRYEFFGEHRNPVHPEQIANLDAVLSLGPGWKPETFAAGAERLLVVSRFGVGYDMCDVPAMTAANVLLTVTTGATDLPVAGGVLAMMLALSRRLFAKDRIVREARWGEKAKFMGTEITGKTLGIVGYGGQGRELRRLVEPFRMSVIAYDPYVSDAAIAENNVERCATLDDLFTRSDYISINCLLNEETRGLIDKGLFDLMKPTAYFFNAARGPIVNEADLIDALRNGKMAGAGLDVFEQEPTPADNPLLSMDNVLLAPHAIAWTDECFQAMGRLAATSILSVMRGERPFGLLNPEVLDQGGFQAKRQAMLARLCS